MRRPGRSKSSVTRHGSAGSSSIAPTAFFSQSEDGQHHRADMDVTALVETLQKRIGRDLVPPNEKRKACRADGTETMEIDELQRVKRHSSPYLREYSLGLR